MATQSSSLPVFFDEDEYLELSEALSKCYLQNCCELFGPAHQFNRIEWYQEFQVFKAVIALSMASLDDHNMVLVNYCQFTLAPMAEYHEVVTRLLRELEDYYHGVGKRVTSGRQVANSIELEDVREKVYLAWKKDVAAGARATGAAEGGYEARGEGGGKVGEA